MKTHEICVYPYGTDEHGDHQHIDNFEKPPVSTGWTVYVREYTGGIDDTWEEVYDEDFPTEEERDAAVEGLRAKYPEATEDWY